MRPEPNTPPTLIAEAIETVFSDCGMIRPRLAEMLAQAVWDALHAHGERWQVIGQMFYDDTTEGQPVLVVPLDAPPETPA